MRFIDGTNAEKALADHPNGMPPERVVRIISKVASALDYAHRHQLLHRDVKPANILLTTGPEDDEETERVFLSDFGVAKAIGEAAERISSLTSTGSVVATLDYASPEQIKGQILDHRSDIYALGCVLYKLLTGTVPFPGDSVAARVYGHLNNLAPPPSSLVPTLPSGFDEVTRRAMAKDAADRYPSCRAMAADCRAALTSPVLGPPGPTADPDDGFPTIMTTAHRADDRPVQPMPPWLGSAPTGTRPEQFGSDSGEHGYPVSGPPTGPHGNTGPARQHRSAGTPAPHGDHRSSRSAPPTGPGNGGPPTGEQSLGWPATQPAQHDHRGERRRGGADRVGVDRARAPRRRAGTASLGTADQRGATTDGVDDRERADHRRPPTPRRQTQASGLTNSPPVPGLPHSTPLPESVLISSRTVADGAPTCTRWMPRPTRSDRRSPPPNAGLSLRDPLARPGIDHLHAADRRVAADPPHRGRRRHRRPVAVPGDAGRL